MSTKLFLIAAIGLTVASLVFAQNNPSGVSLFFGKAGCANCHEVNGRGGIVGPDRGPSTGVATCPCRHALWLLVTRHAYTYENLLRRTMP